MGKKISPRMMKIAKNIKKKQVIQSLHGVLRPKVYITDISSFKRLVQELNGNGRSTVSSSPSPDRPQTISEKFLAADLENNNLDVSMDAAVDLQKHSQGLVWMDQAVDAYRELESWLLDVC